MLTSSNAIGNAIREQEKNGLPTKNGLPDKIPLYTFYPTEFLNNFNDN